MFEQNHPKFDSKYVLDSPQKKLIHHSNWKTENWKTIPLSVWSLFASFMRYKML